MKLETLLLFLHTGWLFIPSHQTLRNGDRLERYLMPELPERYDFWKLWHKVLTERLDLFFHEKVTRGKDHAEVSYNTTDLSDAAAKYGAFVDEMSVERCIWCWNFFRLHSNAMWNLYGPRGVAIITEVAKVKACLLAAGVKRGIVGSVCYIHPHSVKIPDPLTYESNVFRPNMFKNSMFAYEEEIRFVIAANRKILMEKGGVMVRMNPGELITGFMYSPQLQREEQGWIEKKTRALLGSWKSENFVGEPIVEAWSKAYEPYGGTPFTEEDTLPHSFKDLDGEDPQNRWWPSYEPQ